MKKLILMALIVASSLLGYRPFSINYKKVWMGAKLTSGALGLTGAAWLSFYAMLLNQAPLIAKQEIKLRDTHYRHNLISAWLLVPVSIAAIESGLKDLKEFQKDCIVSHA